MADLCLRAVIRWSSSADVSPKASQKRMFRFAFTHKRSSCLKINGALWLWLRPSLRSVSPAADARISEVFEVALSDGVKRCAWGGDERADESLSGGVERTPASATATGRPVTLVNHVTGAADLQRCERHAHLLLCAQETWGISLHHYLQMRPSDFRRAWAHRLMDVAWDCTWNTSYYDEGHQNTDYCFRIYVWRDHLVHTNYIYWIWSQSTSLSN